MSGARDQWRGVTARIAARLAAGFGVVVFAGLIAPQLLFWNALQQLARGQLRLEYERQFSWVPGRLHLRHVRIAGGSWRLTAGAAQGRFRFLDLLEWRPRLRELALEGVRIERLSPAADVARLGRLNEGLARQGSEMPVRKGGLGSAVAADWFVDTLTASIERIGDRAQGWRLSGSMEAEVLGVTGSFGRVTFERAKLKLNESSVEYARAPRTCLSGSMAAGAGELALRRGASLKASLRLRLRGFGVECGKQPSLRATLDGNFELREGRLGEAHTRFELRMTEPWRIDWRNSAVEVVPDATLTGFASNDGDLLGNVSMSELRVAWGRKTSSNVLELHDVVLEQLPLWQRQRSTQHSRSVRVQARDVRFQSSSTSVALRFALSGSLTLDRDEGGLTSSGRLSLGDLRNAKNFRADSPIGMDVTVQRLTWAHNAPDLAGVFELGGNELRGLTSLLDLPRDIVLTLAPFNGQPFTGEGALLASAESQCLSGIRVHTRSLSLAGFVVHRDAATRGAFAITTPLGKLGVRLAETAQVRFAPPPGWLDHEARDRACSPTDRRGGSPQ